MTNINCICFLGFFKTFNETEIGLRPISTAIKKKGLKGGAEAASSHIMFITVLVITALALTILTTQIFIPGLKTDEMVQERTLAYELSYAMNALSLEEAGEVTKKFKEFKITTGIEDGKYFVSVGKEKVFTDAKLKDIVIETGDEISIEKNFEDGYLEVKVA